MRWKRRTPRRRSNRAGSIPFSWLVMLAVCIAAIVLLILWITADLRRANDDASVSSSAVISSSAAVSSDAMISSDLSSDAAQTGGEPTDGADGVSSVTGVAQNPDYIRPGRDANKKYTAYLTFDDGPYKSTKTILKILRQNGVKATFFVVGTQVEKYPEIARQIVAEGHTIGIHCYQHDYEKIYRSVDSYLRDFQKAQDVVYEATGVRPKVFRFPGGSKNNFNRTTYKKIIKAMKAQGNIYYDWNMMFGDAGECTTADGVVQYVKGQIGVKHDVVVLAHDIGARDNTKKALQRVIDLMKKKYNLAGVTMETDPVQWGK